MRKPPKAGIAILGVLGFVCILALPGAGVSSLLFLSTFDLPGPDPQAERGTWVESSAVGGITLVPPAVGGGVGQEVHFDSTGLVGQRLFLTGMFEEGRILDTGRVQLTFRMRMVGAVSPFRVGLIVDNPTSDFTPAGGSGDDGMLWIDQQPTSDSLPVDQDLYFTIEVWRTLRSDDWSYTVSVGYEQPSTESGAGGLGSNYQQINGSGSVDGSMLLPIIGVKLEKPASNAGIIAVDDVRVMAIVESN